MMANKVLRDVLTEQAMKAKNKEEVRDIIWRAMLSGFESGQKQAKDEVKDALRILGFGDMAFKYYADE